MSVANDVVGRTYSKELFPTAARATAAGALAIVGAVGGVLGLAAEGVLFAWLGTHWLPVRAIAACGLAMVAIVAIAYPETSGRTLEEISPDAQPPDAEGAREPSAPGLP